jgi:hypothetical protein
MKKKPNPVVGLEFYVKDNQTGEILYTAELKLRPKDSSSPRFLSNLRETEKNLMETIFTWGWRKLRKKS